MCIWWKQTVDLYIGYSFDKIVFTDGKYTKAKLLESSRNTLRVHLSKTQFFLECVVYINANDETLDRNDKFSSKNTTCYKKTRLHATTTSELATG